MSVHSEQNICDDDDEMQQQHQIMHNEMDQLKEALIEKQNQLLAMETACLNESDRQVELEDSIIAWQDKYDRLYESHKRVQKINQNLEDKLLKLVDRHSNERAQLTSDVATLSVRLAQANYNIGKLQREIERYKTDINLAIQLLQCKPENFVPQKVSSLPIDMQSKVSSYMRLETTSHSDSEDNISGVGIMTSNSYKVLPAVSDSPPPVCPFPPTAMVYSMRGVDAPNSELSNNKNHNNNNCNVNATEVRSGTSGAGGEQLVSPAIIAKYLQDELKANEMKHCDTCQCSTKDLTVLAATDEPKTFSVYTQTLNFNSNNNDHNNLTSLCLRCNNNLNSPSRSTNSPPYIMKFIKSNDSILSETKSNSSSILSDLNDHQQHKIFLTTNKKDDLMVNPILGHHRLCDRTANKLHQAQEQQQHLNETAKYLLENHRKLLNDQKLTTTTSTSYNSNNNDLIDLRKLTDKTGISGISGMMTSTGEFVFNKILNEKNDSSQKCDENLNMKKDHLIQGKSKSDKSVNPINTAEQKKDQICENSQKTTSGGGGGGDGSVTSVWSKNSDGGEGAKLFETFNRNLIKTIKSDNPKHQGPRLCAMRIQSNGASNILLDNIETEVTPVIYTRRPRFLDEELDDNKDIITSKNTLKMEPGGGGGTILDSPLISTSSPILMSAKNIADTTINIEDEHLEQLTTSCNLLQSMPTNTRNEEPQQLGIHNRKYSNTNECIFNAATTPAAASQLDDKLNRLHNNDEQRQFSNKSDNYEMINGAGGELFIHGGMIGGGNSSCKNSKTTCTQSSSISEIDLQETALLRRQQLSRVAEWVQNNSKIEIDEQQQKVQAKELKQQQQQQQNAILQHNNNLENYCTNGNHINMQSENHSIAVIIQNQSPNSLEKLSIDSGYRTTNKNPEHYKEQQIYDNKVGVVSTSNTLDFSKYSNGFMRQSNILYTNHDVMTQNNIIKYQPLGGQHQQQYHNYENVKKDVNFHNNNQSAVENQTVDLAQMEYNVKQFLLKQNEWSIQNLNNNRNHVINSKSPTLSLSNFSSGETTNEIANITDEIIEINTNCTPDLIASNKFYSNLNSNQIYATQKHHHNPHRTETNL